MPPGRVSRVVLSAIALAVVAVVVGGIFAERRSAVVEPEPTPPRSSASPMATAPASTAGTSVASDRFGFVWVDTRSQRLRVMPETGRGGFDLVAQPYRFSWCSCALSPDGTRIAYWTSIAPGVELRVVEVAHPTQEATIYRAADDQRISAAVWSNDGTGILFSLEGVSPPGGPVGGVPNSSLLVIEAGGGAARSLVGTNQGNPAYVPLGWDRAAGVAAAGESGEGGYMRGYLTVRTAGDSAPQSMGISETVLMLRVEASADQRFVLGLFDEPSGSTLRWWKLGDFGTIQSGPRLDHVVRAKWRPLSNEIGWLEGDVLQFLDVERGTRRTGGTFPSGGSLAAFRQDGSAVLTGPATLVEIESGRSETISSAGYAVGSVRFAAPHTQPVGPIGTQPPLNGREVKVIDALGKLGFNGQRVQLPAGDASIWVDFGTATSALFVSVYPLGTVDRNYTVVDERQLAGIVVRHVRRPSSDDTRIRFECSGDEYWTGGAVPPGFASMDAFVERLITALACPP